jgi:hypothetical protein
MKKKYITTLKVVSWPNLMDETSIKMTIFKMSKKKKDKKVSILRHTDTQTASSNWGVTLYQDKPAVSLNVNILGKAAVLHFPFASFVAGAMSHSL